MKKKLLILLLGASMTAITISGCSSEEKETEKVTTEAATTEAATTEEATTEEATTEEATTEEATTEAATTEEATTEEATTEEATTEEATTEAATTEEATTEEATTEEATTEEATTEEATTEEATTEEATTEEATTEEATTEEATTEEATTEEATTEEETTEEATTEEATTEEATTEEATTEEETTEEATTEEATTEAPLEYTVSFGESVSGTLDDMDLHKDDIVILYNNDIHGGISSDENYSGSDSSLGYAGLAAVKEDVSKNAIAVTTVDLGDAIQGSVVCTESDGKDVMDLMGMIGYDLCIPGNHEFDYGMDIFLEYAENSDADFLSCNFVSLEDHKTVFDGYKMITYTVNGEDFDVAYIGMSTPETITKSTPTYFQDEEGNYIYGFSADSPEELYETVQNTIDEAESAGADCIIALGHMGDSGVEEGWSSEDVIGNTCGIDVFLDGHAHSTIPGEMIKDKDGEEVLLTSTGTKLENIGVLKLCIEKDGNVTATSGLVNELTKEQKESETYKKMTEEVEKIQSKYEYLFVKVGELEDDLVIIDPATDNRIVRTQETNMGDFLTDAYRAQLGTDIAFLNGGSIRANISAGDILYMDLITVLPWNSEAGIIEVTGQQILDCLEMGARMYPEECGGFIQPSGLTYSIDTTIPSSVKVNSDGEFVSVEGDYRVKDVMVGDKALDLKKTYTLAINTYYSQDYGDGMTMFKDSKAKKLENGEDVMIDHDIVIDYIASLDDKVGKEYADPYGQGRITFITEETVTEEETTEEAATEEVTTEEVTTEEVTTEEVTTEEATTEEETTEAATKTAAKKTVKK